MDYSRGRKIFDKHFKDGWVDKYPDEIAETMKPNDISARIDLEKELWGHFYNREVEFENEEDIKSRYRFVNDF